MTADELKSMNKGNFIVMKTGTHPFISKLKLFFKLGIDFDCEPYSVDDKGARKVEYTNKDIIEDEILKKFPHLVVSQKAAPKATSKAGNSNDMAQSHTPIRTEGQIQEPVEAEEHSPKELQQSIPVRTN